jgi:hypothetical protein
MPTFTSKQIVKMEVHDDNYLPMKMKQPAKMDLKAQNAPLKSNHKLIPSCDPELKSCNKFTLFTKTK